jgi:hypothetical protein
MPIEPIVRVGGEKLWSVLGADGVGGRAGSLHGQDCNRAMVGPEGIDSVLRDEGNGEDGRHFQG